MSWQQQVESEERRRQEELYCPYCGHVIGDEGRAMCCRETGHGVTYDEISRIFGEYDDEINNV